MNPNRFSWLRCVLGLSAVTASCYAGDMSPVKVSTQPAAIHNTLESQSLQANSADRQWFIDAKFGMFIHWGPVSLRGTEIGWSRGGERRGTGGSGTVPVADYDTLYQKFNPIQFNAEEWVRIAEKAGMKYLVFTTKHHDGFSMFDTKLSDYKITKSPFERDVCAELASACHRHGMRLGWYYSPVDWHHPDYRTAKHRRYVEYMHGQLRELCTNYGKIDVIWFDGLGGSSGDWDAENLFKMIRGLQPGILINSRAGLPGDFDTPEQRIGSFQTERPWETCMTLGDQWSWKPQDRVKSLEECTWGLVRTVGSGGNLLLNVGPMPNGEIEPRQVTRLEEIGKWMDTVGPSVYATRGGPFPPAAWGTCAWRGNSVFLHVLEWDPQGIILPGIKNHVVGVNMLDGTVLRFKQGADKIKISAPPIRREMIDSVVVLEFDAPADRAHPSALHSGSLARGKKASQSGTGRSDDQNPPGNAVDDDYSTCWLAHVGLQPALLQVDLGRPMRIDHAIVCEVLDRVRNFEIQYEEQNTWRTATGGTQIGNRIALRFDPVTAQRWRLNILRGDGAIPPQIGEFQLFAPEDY